MPERPSIVIFSAAEIAAELTQLGISHIVWLPDSDIGPWEAEFEASSMKLVRICREGEAWPLAAGLKIGGQRPMILMQTTGLFESGDALRNILYDLKIPLFAIIGARNWLNLSSRDSARLFAEPILKAWQLDYVLIESRDQHLRLAEHYQHCRREGKSGAILLAE